MHGAGESDPGGFRDRDDLAKGGVLMVRLFGSCSASSSFNSPTPKGYACTNVFASGFSALRAAYRAALAVAGERMHERERGGGANITATHTADLV